MAEASRQTSLSSVERQDKARPGIFDSSSQMPLPSTSSSAKQGKIGAKQGKIGARPLVSLFPADAFHRMPELCLREIGKRVVWPRSSLVRFVSDYWKTDAVIQDKVH